MFSPAEQAANHVVDATAKLEATPAPDAWTVANADIAQHSATVYRTTPDQIVAAQQRRS